MTYIFPHPEKEPWIYPAIRRVIGNEPRDGALVYGGKIYSDKELMPDALEHELLHVEQQRGRNKVLWALRYLFSKEFRLKVELEAYRHQYRFICSIEHDRNLRAQALRSMANDLASGTYGRIVSFEDAMQYISVAAA